MATILQDAQARYGAGEAGPRRADVRDAERPMVWLGGGTFTMGSDTFYREERPARSVTVEAFWMDVEPVTNQAFAGFVEATGYVTLAELAPAPQDYPDAGPALLAPGSSVFCKPPGPVDRRDWRAWWRYLPGASWRRPEGPGSDLSGREAHPVVHVAWRDARAYAAWAGKSLPTEAEWEFAARGALEGATYAWGEEFAPEGRFMANTWQGRFPWENLATDGYEGASPVGAFPPNAYGLFDMIGNVWEWTSSPFLVEPPRACCGSAAADAPHRAVRVVKGGSFLCAPNYCFRYRPAARQAQSIDSSTSHIGFRCVARPTPCPGEPCKSPSG